MATKITMSDEPKCVRFDELQCGEWFMYGNQLRRKVTKDTYHIVCISNSECRSSNGCEPVQPVDVEIIVRPKGV